MNVVLEGDGPVLTGPEWNWWIEDNRVSVRGADSIATYNLPRHCRRTVLYRLGGGRSQLVLGGFKSITVTIIGPTKQIEELREAVL